MRKNKEIFLEEKSDIWLRFVAPFSYSLTDDRIYSLGKKYNKLNINT